MMAVEGSQARAAAPVQHTWATQTELSYLSDAASFATWGAKDAATQTDVKHQSAAVQTVSMGTHMVRILAASSSHAWQHTCQQTHA